MNVSKGQLSNTKEEVRRQWNAAVNSTNLSQIALPGKSS